LITNIRWISELLLNRFYCSLLVALWHSVRSTLRHHLPSFWISNFKLLKKAKRNTNRPSKKPGLNDHQRGKPKNPRREPAPKTMAHHYMASHHIPVLFRRGAKNRTHNLNNQRPQQGGAYIHYAETLAF
jgi:hypothetical protein